MQIVKNINGKSEAEEKIQVILAEEHPFTAKLAKKALAEGGIEVHIASSERNLLELVKKIKIDIVMVDIKFNKQKNLEFLHHIRPESINKEIKIILTSATPVKRQLSPLIKAQIDLYLIKPVPQIKMIEKIKKLMKKKIRGSPRVKLNFPIVVFSDERKIHTKVRDISISGLHIEDKNNRLAIEIGQVLTVHMSLPLYKKPLVLKGRIVRLTDEGAGLKLLNMSALQKNKIAKTVEEYTEQQEQGDLHYL